MITNKKYKEEKKQMLEAIRLGRLQEVVDRVQADPDLIHHTDRGSGLTLLQRAAFHGQVPIAAYLLSHGAVAHLDNSPPQPTCDRKVPPALYLAAIKGHADMVQLLLSYSADPNLGTDAGTPLMAASVRGFTEVVRCLLKHRLGRAGVNFTNKCGQTALCLACREGRVEVVWDLLEAGADMRMASPGGPTAVAVALAYGHDSCAAVLLKWLERRAGLALDNYLPTALPPPTTTARPHLPLPLPLPPSSTEDEGAEHDGGLRPAGCWLKRSREEGEGEDVTRSRLPRHRSIPSSFYSMAQPRSTASFPSLSTHSRRPVRPSPLYPSSSVPRSPSSPSPISPDPYQRHQYEDEEEEEAASSLSRLRKRQRRSYSSESFHVLGGGGRLSAPPRPSSPSGSSSTSTAPQLAAQRGRTGGRPFLVVHGGSAGGR